jgi:hypothetical protein
MDNPFNILAIEVAEQRVRARRAEQRLQEVEQMLDTLGITLWQTDHHLRLTNSHGMIMAESYVERHISDFFRDVFGIEDYEAEPLVAHRDAQVGQRVTLGLNHDGRQFAILVDPRRNTQGDVVGTVGMAVELAE